MDIERNLCMDEEKFKEFVCEALTIGKKHREDPQLEIQIF